MPISRLAEAILETEADLAESPLMAPLVGTGEAAAAEFALLTDRVRLARGQKQLYGTQFAPDENGVRRPRPIEDLEHLDSRRDEMGLAPIEDYARELGRSYGQPTSPQPLLEDPPSR